MSENPSCLSHISLGSNDLTAALPFYDAVLATVGCKRIMEHPEAVAYGKMYPEFWICRPLDDTKPASVGNGTHVSFFADSKAQVDAFYDVAVQHGATADGKRVFSVVVRSSAAAQSSVRRSKTTQARTAPGIRQALLRLLRQGPRRPQDRSHLLGPLHGRKRPLILFPDPTLLREFLGTFRILPEPRNCSTLSYTKTAPESI